MSGLAANMRGPRTMLAALRVLAGLRGGDENGQAGCMVRYVYSTGLRQTKRRLVWTRDCIRSNRLSAGGSRLLPPGRARLLRRITSKPTL